MPPVAAAGAARALGLDAPTATRATGLATAGTGGVKAAFGTDAKPVLCGCAAEAGLTAALLAARGLSGPADALENHRGIARLFNDGLFLPEAFDMLGRTWRLLDPGIDVKRIPVCLSSHAAVDGLREILAENRLALADVEAVACDVTPIVAANLAYPRPSSPREAQFSLEFALAAVLVHGDVTLALLEPDALGDSRLRATMARISMRSSERWQREPALTARCPEAAHVTVVVRDGKHFERLAAAARGTVGRPLGDAEIRAKFMACAERAIGGKPAERLLERLETIERLGSPRELLAGIA